MPQPCRRRSARHSRRPRSRCTCRSRRCGSRADTVIVPPSGIASRALMIRFISASSSCARRHKAPRASCAMLPVELDQAAQRVREQVGRRRSRARRCRSAAGSSCWRRAKASRRRTSSEPCSAARRVMPRIFSLLVRRVGSRRSIRPSPPSTAASRLLKSCAMPPVSLPIASILRAWTSWLSSSLRSVTSSSVPAYSTGRRRRRGAAPPGRGNACTAVGAPPAIFDRRDGRSAATASARRTRSRSSGWRRSAHSVGFSLDLPRMQSRSAPRNCR